MSYYRGHIQHYTNQGWEVVSEGPSGAQLREPKKMRSLDRAVLVVGIPLVFLWGLGVLLIAIALIDYIFLTPQKTLFIPSDIATPAPGQEEIFRKPPRRQPRVESDDEKSERLRSEMERELSARLTRPKK